MYREREEEAFMNFVTYMEKCEKGMTVIYRIAGHFRVVHFHVVSFVPRADVRFSFV